MELIIAVIAGIVWTMCMLDLRTPNRNIVVLDDAQEVQG